MTRKREVLSCLTRDELHAAADSLGLELADRRAKDTALEALAQSKRASLDEILSGFKRDRLKDLCRALGLDDSGKQKDEIVARLASGTARSAAAAKMGLAFGPAAAALDPTPPPLAATGVPATSPPRRATPVPSTSTKNTVTHSKQFQSFSEASNFLWSIADLLRGDYRQHDYGKVILPLTVLRRLDCVLADTKAKVLEQHAKHAGGSVKNLDPVLNRITGVHFHNVSKLDFARLKDDPNHLKENLVAYINGFSAEVREIFLERFRIQEQIAKLDDANVLYLVVSRFADVDLHPDAVDNHMMGSIFEDLIRRFAEQSNETAGEHFTPREVVRLMVNLLFAEDDAALRTKGVVRTIFDPACGTGGMLSVAEEHLRRQNPDAHLELFGQELNDESFAICKADMLLKAENPGNVVRGNSFSEDGHAGRRFDYMLSNPPFGVEWKKVEAAIRDESEKLGFKGRFGAGLPRINDGSFLFLQHMIAKMKPVQDGGSRLAIVFNGSPLFSGDAGSGESEIRRWILENDWLEAIIGLPDQMFFNTGISTYLWILTNRKSAHRRGKVQLVNATDLFRKMRKSLGNKRNELAEEHMAEITRLYREFQEGERSKIFPNEAFGYRKITVERPLRLDFQASAERVARLEDEKAFAGLAASKKKGDAGLAEMAEGRALQDAVRRVLGGLDAEMVHLSRDVFEAHLAKVFKQAGVKVPAPAWKALLSALSERNEQADVCRDARGNVECDAELRDTESVPLLEDVGTYVEREVKPHVPDAWIDESKTKVGCEIPFTRHFYKCTPLRPLRVIDEEIQNLEAEIRVLLGGLKV